MPDNYNVCMKLFVAFCMVFVCERLSAQQTLFPDDFAPSEDFVKPQERPVRDGLCLNGLWHFAPVEKANQLPKEKLTDPVMPVSFEWDAAAIKIPSPWNVNNFATDDGSGGDFVTYPGYPKKWEGIKAGWLMRKIAYNTAWKNKRLILHFDAVAGYSCVYINRHKVGSNFELFLPFEIDVTNYLKPGEENELLVWVADAQLFNEPGKYGRRIHVAGSFWGQHAIGIWQDVNLIAKPQVYIQNTFVKPFVDKDELEIEATIVNTSNSLRQIDINGDAAEWINLAGKSVIEAPQPAWKLGKTALSLPNTQIIIGANETKKITIKVGVNGRLRQWEPGNPNLYGLVISLLYKGQVTDKLFTRFGWRQFNLSKSGLLLNGRPIVLKGDSWHFMGVPQMTRRYAWAWYKLLQNSHANAVRLHAQPYPSFYMDMADEMGICVLDESGMWASDGGPKIDGEAYWKNSYEHLTKLILRDRNHPSVFGWSVCNENIPVVKFVFHAPDSIVNRQLSEINKWVHIAQDLDPSRTWISGDGETGAPTILPTVIGHYGDEGSYKEWSSTGKVWGIGESGMAYYATPQQSAVYNGNRSYESQQGRMEGVAMEAAKILELQKKYNASYSSVFNLVWYGIKPLPLGLKDTTRAPLSSDGIFFGAYKEGVPGYQPERLGPYTTTLNPGYDPSLPAYSEWPLLKTISKAFADDKQTAIVTGAINNKEIPQGIKHNPVNVKLISADKDSVLYHILKNSGVNLSNNLPANAGSLLIIDGRNAPADSRSITLKQEILKRGGNVLIWGISKKSLDDLNKYLPSPVEITDRNSTSFIVKQPDQFMGELTNADFYFSELSEKPVMTNGITGPFVQSGTVLLQAANTDWKKWNKRAEYLKTAAVLRSEREYKPGGNALVEVKEDNGKIYLLAIDAGSLYSTVVNVYRQLLVNLGVQFQHGSNNEMALGENGLLKKALVLAPIGTNGKTIKEIAETDFLKGVNENSFFAGARVNNLIWQNGTVHDGWFELDPKASTESVVAYLSFWIYSPRSLSNLLLEPDLPRLGMAINTENGFQVSLNKKVISDNSNSTGKQIINALPIEKGWNHFVIKTIHKTGNWKIAVKFDCDKKEFFANEIRSLVTK
jgi:beta-galactosidase